ncbi:MAG: hypothetical protein ABR540_11065, partial [Acidimicrobiales bacterium]
RRRRSPGRHHQAAPPAPDEPFVQLLPEALDDYCREVGLRFDERCLLEHLLCTASHTTGRLSSVTLAGLATQLGLGPSARGRTLRKRLDRLAGTGAVSWRPSGGDRPGAIEVLVYRRLVRAGRRSMPGRFVQVMPGAFDALVKRYRLGPDARALLRRLALDVDPATHQLATTPTELATSLGITWRRLLAITEELVDAGVLGWSKSPSSLALTAYPAVVRIGEGRAPEPRNRAPIPAKSRPPVSPPPHERSPDQTLPPFPPPTSTPSLEPEGQGSDLVTALGARLLPAEREALFRQSDRRCVAALTNELNQRVAGGWSPDELLEALGGALPPDWQSPAAVMLSRARALEVRPPALVSEDLAGELHVARAEARRREEAAAARALARNWARLYEPADLLAELDSRFSAEAYREALEELVEMGGPAGEVASQALNAQVAT